MESYVLSYAFRKNLWDFFFLLVLLYRHVDSYCFFICITHFFFFFFLHLVRPIVDPPLLGA